LLALALAAALPSAAAAQTPPTVVSMGDSAISGEAGRWAGNTNQSSSKTDALGPSAYNDAGNAEAIVGCHRSRSAEVHIGDGVRSVNLACSGARTYTHTGDDGHFKPGLDMAANSQVQALQTLAADNKNIKAVVVLIGANNYGFADIVQACVTDWLTSPSWWKNYCQDDSDIRSRFTASNITTITNQVRGAFNTIRDVMSDAGYSDSQYEILAQTYSAPLPMANGMRYPETGFTRQTIGGCGTWNSDVNWARSTVVDTFNKTIRNAVAGMPNVSLLDMTNALLGRRLCENTVGLLEEKGLASWTSAGAVNKTEWVQQIRTLTTIFPPYQLQEDGHPNYWGQLALRNCFRQAYAGGNAHGGYCSHGTDLNAKGEPNMALTTPSP
jgi:GDSL-like Lipase/Acylhydrolase family